MERLNDLFFSSKASDGLTYEQILTDVQRFVTQNHADTLSNEGNPEEARKLLKDYILQYVQNRSYHVDGQTTEELVDSLYEDMAGMRHQRTVRNGTALGFLPSMPMMISKSLPVEDTPRRSRTDFPHPRLLST